MRRAAKIDDNHKQIVLALRNIGCHVQSLAAIGKGCPDVLVSYRDKWFVMEIKDGKKPPSARKLTDDERAWIISANARVYVVNNVDEAIEAVCTPTS